jgi:hypothetical protein
MAVIMISELPAGWAASIAAALRYRLCPSSVAPPPGMLRAWRSRPARRVGPEMPDARCARRPRSKRRGLIKASQGQSQGKSRTNLQVER